MLVEHAGCHAVAGHLPVLHLVVHEDGHVVQLEGRGAVAGKARSAGDRVELLVQRAVQQLREVLEVLEALERRVGGVVGDLPDGALGDELLGLEAGLGGGVDGAVLDAQHLRDGAVGVADGHDAVVLHVEGGLGGLPHGVQRLVQRSAHLVGGGVEHVGQGVEGRVVAVGADGLPGVQGSLVGGPAQQLVAGAVDVVLGLGRDGNVDDLAGHVLARRGRAEVVGAAAPHAALGIEDDLARGGRVEQTQDEHLAVAHHGAGRSGGKRRVLRDAEGAADGQEGLYT